MIIMMSLEEVNYFILGYNAYRPLAPNFVDNSQPCAYEEMRNNLIKHTSAGRGA